MPIEAATYIHQLDATNPAGSDPVADTDNHLRIIKQAIKNTFPFVTGPVALSQYGLNGGVPIGGIILWSGSFATIPTGWILCAGQTVSRSDGGGNIVAPNLMDKFIVGAGAAYAVAATGGAITQTGTTDNKGSHSHPGAGADAAGAHSHGGVTLDHVLTVAELPRHDHPIYYSNSTTLGTGGFGFLRGAKSGASSQFSDYNGSSVGHNHGILADGYHAHTLTIPLDGGHDHAVSVADGRPPYYALAYIMKV